MPLNMRARHLLMFSLTCLTGCAGSFRMAPVQGDLGLDAVVLYRNGIGYFERSGTVNGDTLSIKVRKDQVDDLLKSLTVVNREGKVVSVSMPLDPASWSRAALATLQPGYGNLPNVLSAMAGTDIIVHTNSGNRINGRIVMVEEVVNEPGSASGENSSRYGGGGLEETRDHKLTVMAGNRMHVVRLSQMRGFTIKDGDLAMQLQRTLDAAAGEGMFEQVEVQIHLNDARSHDLMISYVVAAPMWKPTYRVVLADDGPSLLQGWAVVDNVSGEDWRDVELSLTSGSPIAFRYNLKTPRTVGRADLTGQGVPRQAAVAMGETSYAEAEEDMAEPTAATEGLGMVGSGRGGGGGIYRAPAKKKKSRRRNKLEESSDMEMAGNYGGVGYGRGAMPSAAAPAPSAEPRLDYDALRQSTMAQTRAREISGLTQVTVEDPVTVPDGASTMVAMINQDIEAEQVLMYKPGGAGAGFERNPYRVVRFTNATDYVLESGPISVYQSGSFVGEGIANTVGAGESVTIPFSVEPSVGVTSDTSASTGKTRLLRVVRGVFEVETYYERTTTWKARLKERAERDLKILIRHTRASVGHELVDRPEGTEDVDGGYLVPLMVNKGGDGASVKLVERTPSKSKLSIWDSASPKLLSTILEAEGIDPELRARLQPILDARQNIGLIDTKVEGLRRQQVELDKRANETRANLEAIKKDPKAGALRKRLNKRMEEFSNEGNAIGREIVELNRQRLELKIDLDDRLLDLSFTPTDPISTVAK